MRIAKYSILKSDKIQLVLKDIGPWNFYPTITNSIDEIVDLLYKAGHLPNERKLF